MLKPQRAWNRADALALQQMVASGMQSPAIGAALGRTAQSVRNKAKHLGLSLKRGGTGAPPKITWQEIQAVKCALLRDAINELLDRTPAIAVDEIMGKRPPPIPGTERIHKTSSIQRLAA